ncbi:MAG: aminotransferase class I/II-fold pyridoxal phosphate-dependent enzyme [Bacteroidales bacterium]|nr:aminotransferase class I/II-fold pyridoxal phosphate-dependent enzyme [Bacteroidales bacterium]
MKEFNPEQFRSEGHRIVDLLAEYLEEATKGEGYAVLPVSDPDELAEYFTLDSGNGRPESYITIVNEFIKYSNHLHNPGYIGHQCTSPLPLGALSHLTATLLNNGSAVYEMGPANSAMERAVIKHLAAKMGFDKKADGILTHGGSAGNLTALLAARQAKCSYNIWEEGVRENMKPGFLVSAESHYSVVRNLKIMGLGAESAVTVRSGDGFRMDPGSFSHAMKDAEKNGINVIGMVASSCSTATGSYDNLMYVAEFCKKHDLWMHVDGAHGMGVVFSDRYRHLVKGVEAADSVIIDFHKMLLTPGLNTAVLFKDGDRSYETFEQKASYLFSQGVEREWYNGAKRSLECTKSSMGFVAWSLFRYYGDSLFSDYIDDRYDTAAQFGAMIEGLPDFELLTPPQSNIVCFRHIQEGKSPTELNAHNDLLREKLIADGTFYIVKTTVDGNVWLRVTIINPLTGMETLKRLIEKLREIAGKASI